VDLSNILQQEGTTLTKLHLHSTDIDDEDIEILANSLKRNTTLTNLCLTGNKITDIGYRTILELLNDVSSIENTYNSNHTLLDLFLSNGAYWDDNDTPTMKKINRHTSMPDGWQFSRRSKVERLIGGGLEHMDKD